MIALFWILIVISVVLIVVSFIMAPDSNSFSGALVGSSDLELFKVTKVRGFKLWLNRSMWILGFALIISAILIRTLM